MQWEEPPACQRCEKQPEFCTCIDRSLLDAERADREKERALWARLVKAEQAHHDQTVLLGERDDDMTGAFAEVDAARQGLRDLGVNVDAL